MLLRITISSNIQTRDPDHRVIRKLSDKFNNLSPGGWLPAVWYTSQSKGGCIFNLNRKIGAYTRPIHPFIDVKFWFQLNSGVDSKAWSFLPGKMKATVRKWRSPITQFTIEITKLQIKTVINPVKLTLRLMKSSGLTEHLEIEVI